MSLLDSFDSTIQAYRLQLCWLSVYQAYHLGKSDIELSHPSIHPPIHPLLWPKFQQVMSKSKQTVFSPFFSPVNFGGHHFSKDQPDTLMASPMTHNVRGRSGKQCQFSDHQVTIVHCKRVLLISRSSSYNSKHSFQFLVLMPFLHAERQTCVDFFFDFFF